MRGHVSKGVTIRYQFMRRAQNCRGAIPYGSFSPHRRATGSWTEMPRQLSTLYQEKSQ